MHQYVYMYTVSCYIDVRSHITTVIKRLILYLNRFRFSSRMYTTCRTCTNKLLSVCIKSNDCVSYTPVCERVIDVSFGILLLTLLTGDVSDTPLGLFILLLVLLALLTKAESSEQVS